jgi:hypothetical protein
MPTGKEIISRAGVLLSDEQHVRWTLPELCDWINEGLRAIVLAKPSAFSKTVVLALGSGTHQTVPTTGNPIPLMLISVTRNIIYTPPVSDIVPPPPPPPPPAPGTIVDVKDPRKSGRTIRRADRSILDSLMPNWHIAQHVQFSKEVRNYCFDELVPLEYLVYPGNDGTGFVEAKISFQPPPLVATGSPQSIDSYTSDLGLPEPYSVPLLDYTLYRCQMKDDTDGAAGRSAIHYQQFATAIGMKVQVEQVHSPNARP